MNGAQNSPRFSVAGSLINTLKSDLQPESNTLLNPNDGCIHVAQLNWMMASSKLQLQALFGGLVVCAALFVFTVWYSNSVSAYNEYQKLSVLHEKERFLRKWEGKIVRCFQNS
jgi:hypothetical protein